MRNQTKERKMEMNVSNELIEKMKEFEGCKLESYKCPAGVWTIGIGHTRGVRRGQRITMAQAESLLRNDLLKFEKEVSAMYPHATQYQFDALVSLAFNAGMGAVSGNLHSLISRGASRFDIQDWWRNHYVTANGKQLAGLVRRRAWEAEWYYMEG